MPAETPTNQTQAPVPASGPAPRQGGDLWSTALVMLPMLAVFYFLMIRPQKKQEKERRTMLDALQKNDPVLTVGGIYGTVAAVNGDEITLKVDENKDVRVRVSRGAIQAVLKDAGGKS